MPVLFYFWAFVVLLAAALVPVMLKPEKIYEYPYFMAAVFAGFIVPQAISLIRFPGSASQEWIANVLLMTCLCFGMCWMGYQSRPIKFFQKGFAQPPALDRLFQGGVLFVIISFFFSYLISRMTPEETGADQWTGIVTIYAFFANLIYPGFAICLIVALRNHTFFAWVVTLVASLQPLQAVIIYGRRENAAHFLMTLAITLYFERGFKPPRTAVIAAVVGAMLIIPATGTYRSLMKDGSWDEAKQFDVMDNFNNYLNQESILELRNAAMAIEAVRETGNYQWGKGYWDELVFRFVPAQIVGRETKDNLMFIAHEKPFPDLDALGYSFPVGSTPTGIGDVFNQFGWFGCLFFAVSAWFFKNLWRKAQGNLFARIFYIQLVPTAMLTLTHGTVVSLPDVAYYGIFLGLLFYYARKPVQTGTKKGRRPVGWSPARS